MEWLLRLAEPWAGLYGDSPPLQTVVLFAHLAGLLAAGGFAVAADHATLRTPPGDAGARERHLANLAETHVVVLAGLSAAVTSGVLMLAADLETYLSSPVFWIKMGLLVLLLTNGYALRRAGIVLRRDPGGAWRRLQVSSAASIALWFAVLLAGTWLSGIS
jgi:hypothetical protein